MALPFLCIFLLPEIVNSQSSPRVNIVIPQPSPVPSLSHRKLPYLQTVAGQSH